MINLLTDIRFIIAVIICLCIIAAVFGVCMYLRYRRDNEASPIGGNLSVAIGNAQIIGTREKQDDSFATSIMPYGVMAIVADGIGGYINGNLASKIAVETYLDEFERRNATDNISYYFQTSAVLSNGRIRDEFGEAKGGTTAVAVVLAEGKPEELFVKPSEDVKKFLGEEGQALPKTGVNVQLFFTDDSSDEPVITEMARELGIDFSICWAKLEEFRENVFGSLILNIQEEDKERVFKFLESKHVTWEVL